MATTEALGGANSDQEAYWNSPAGEKWVENQEKLDAAMAALNDRLLAVARPAAGERVLDIGCGAGATALAVGRLVGPTGSVVGIDVSGPLLDRANERKREAGLRQIEYVLADAQTHDFAPESFDVLVSRFGVMFFSDPVAAFRNLRKALRSGGRAAFLAWGGMAANPWFSVPQNAAVALLGPVPPPPLRAPGPLAFADIAYVLDVLRQAGFSDVSAGTEEVPLLPPGRLAEVARFACTLGPASRIVSEHGGTPEDVDAISRRVADGFRKYEVDGVVRVPASVNIFTMARH